MQKRDVERRDTFLICKDKNYTKVMIKLTIGSTVIGVSGRKLIVDRVEGDIFYSGELKIKISAVVRVILPTPVNFKLGDRVQYVGTDLNLVRQYSGVLEIWKMGKGGDFDKCTCLKPNDTTTSWIDFTDLELVEVAA